MLNRLLWLLSKRIALVSNASNPLITTTEVPNSARLETPLYVLAP